MGKKKRKIPIPHQTEFEAAFSLFKWWLVFVTIWLCFAQPWITVIQRILQ